MHRPSTPIMVELAVILSTQEGCAGTLTLRVVWLPWFTLTQQLLVVSPLTSSPRLPVLFPTTGYTESGFVTFLVLFFWGITGVTIVISTPSMLWRRTSCVLLLGGSCSLLMGEAQAFVAPVTPPANRYPYLLMAEAPSSSSSGDPPRGFWSRAKSAMKRFNPLSYRDHG